MIKLKMMKKCKIVVFAKDLLTVRFRRQVVERRSFHVTTTIILLLSMASFVVILGMFVNEHVGKFLVSEEIYFTDDNQLPYLSPPPPCQIMALSRSENGGGRSFIRDWTSPPNNNNNNKEIWHSMSDDELIRLASMAAPNKIEGCPYYNRNPNNNKKVAFMFLSRGRLPLAPLWEKFFKGYQGLYSIYLHTSTLDFTEVSPNSSVFYKRRIPSKPAEWGKPSMIDAERRLLANALLDFSNERFVLLSETCIPLFNFTTVYNYLINSKYSNQGSFDDPRPMGRGRYNKRMLPTVSLSDWRKGSQWFEVHRKIAMEMISDVTYYPVFRDHCRPPCYMDEHYFATLVTKLLPESNSNRSITWVDWSRGGSHPARFLKRDVSEKFLNGIRHGFKCSYNNGGVKTNICFLFARKFHPNTLGALLRIAPALLGFDP